MQGGDSTTTATVVLEFTENNGGDCELDAEDDFFYLTWSDQLKEKMK